MKLSIAAIITLSSSVYRSFGLVPSEVTFSPYRIDFDEIKDDDSFQVARSDFVEALTRVGMVAVTNIPFRTKQKTLTLLHECAMESAATLKHTFKDGTVRHTMATHTVPGGMQTIDHGTTACDGFSEASNDLRQTVATVTEVFAARLSSILDLEDTTAPLLTTSQGYPFTSLVDVVEYGEHLEHFHSYQRTSFDTAEATIDFHVDQGLFIAFVPAVLVNTQDNSDETASTVSDGFFIELQDGSRVMVKFSANDDLVFLLGDGVNQIIKSRLSRESTTLRAPPHALTMPNHGVGEARVWYGRMVLAPFDALHPMNGITFGEIRQGMIETRGEEQLTLGCSSTMGARKLDETECPDDNTLYCWHQCMNATEFAVSDEICADQGLDLRCINPRSQLYVDGHGDYYPACINASAAINATDYPPLENAPRDESVCTLADYQAFATKDKYENQVVIKNATLSWTVTDGVLDGRLAFNGLFGWLAFGLANVGGELNGMLGASIIMAQPGGNYNASTGLDLTVGNTITEYMIDPNNTAFRHWSDPVLSVSRSSEIKEYDVEANDCFTAITFKTSSINGINFNFDGKDELLWAGNGADYFVGYHGPDNRARFAVDWTTGVVTDGNGNQLSNGNSTVAPSAPSSAPVQAHFSMAMIFVTGLMVVVGYMM